MTWVVPLKRKEWCKSKDTYINLSVHKLSCCTIAVFFPLCQENRRGELFHLSVTVNLSDCKS